MGKRVRALLPELLLAVLVTVVVTTLLVGARPTPDRAEQLAAGLRCPVCQSESVADSRSETALAMRARIDELVAQGWSDEQIVDHFVARYGDWIVLDPPFDARSAALWLLPPAALTAALLAIRRWRRTGGETAETGELEEAQRERLRAEIALMRRGEGSR